MRVIKRKLKGDEGEISLVPENLDDLWHLKYIIETGDLVFSHTKRTMDGATDKIRPEKGEKKVVRLGVRVEKVEFHRFSNRLRIHGKIEVGIDEGSYHTLSIEPGKELTILKEKWKSEQLKRIEDAIKASRRAEIVILILEEGEAEIGILREFGVEPFSSLRMGYGKGMGSQREDFFRAVYEHLAQLDSDYIILAGPGFAKDDFHSFLKEKHPDVARKTVIESTSTGGRRGFVEVIRRGAVKRIGGEIRLSMEADVVEKILSEISKDGMAVYGLEDVMMANSYGAIEILAVVDEFLREQREIWDIDGLMLEVERNGGRVVVLSSEFEPGKQIMGLGGIAAVLRFRIH